MQPTIEPTWVGLIVAVVAAQFLGWLWYGPLFGKKWATLMGMDPEKPPEGHSMAKAMIMMIIGAFLTAWVLMHSVQVWQPSSWGLEGDGPLPMYGFFAGLFTWLGFYLPVQLNTVAWEMRPWSLFGINAGYHFVTLQVMGQALANL